MTFSQLLKEVEKIEGLRRIRFMTSHPKDLSDELIQTMAESKKSAIIFIFRCSPEAAES